MIPLHKDNFLRQKMFYIKALELLNETVTQIKWDNEKYDREKTSNMY